MDNLSSEDKQRMALFLKTVRENPYIKQKPTEKQAIFLMKVGLEGFLGGSAGPGKSSALLMASLQYVTFPKYAAIIFRRTYKDLALPGALMDRAYEWLYNNNGAKYDDTEKTWHFPSGATLTFGYLEAENDRFRYQSSEFQCVSFDELSQFSEQQYTYLFSRLRRLKDSDIPIRMRVASNPGGVGAEWVKDRFITHSKTNPNDPNRFFIPANMYDNPFLDHAEYEKSLENLDPITKAQLKDGNWDISFNSGLFKREWFEFVQTVPRGRTIRCWDMAATEQKDYNDPDWTVGVLMTESQGQYFIKDVVRFRKAPGEAEKLIRQTAEMDGKAVSIYMEQEPGSSGVGMIDHYARYVLQGYPFYGVKASGDKVTRAQGLSAAASHHNVKIYSGVAHISDLLSELDMFPLGKHDDFCFVVGTKIATIKGNINIEDIRIGDTVIIPGGTSKVTGVSNRNTEIITRIGLTGTYNHPVFTHQKGFILLGCVNHDVRVDSLCVKNQIRWTNQRLLYSIMLNTDSWERSDIISASQNLMREEEKQKGYMSLYMNIIQEHSFLKGLLFTTKIIIHSIISLKILSVFHVHNMLNSIKCGQKMVCRNNLLIWQKSENSQKNGTLHQKDWNGIGSMPKILWLKHTFQDLIRYVISVGKNLNLVCLTQNTALNYVHQDTDMPHMDTKGSELQQKEEGGIKQVYNLSTGAHVYYANGILVSNCDATSAAFNQLSGGGSPDRFMNMLAKKRRW